MNTANLTPQRSRQLAIGLLVLAIIAVIAAIALPAWWLYAPPRRPLSKQAAIDFCHAWTRELPSGRSAWNPSAARR